jgi:hypothetical protein
VLAARECRGCHTPDTFCRQRIEYHGEGLWASAVWRMA